MYQLPSMDGCLLWNFFWLPLALSAGGWRGVWVFKQAGWLSLACTVPGKPYLDWFFVKKHGPETVSNGSGSPWWIAHETVLGCRAAEQRTCLNGRPNLVWNWDLGDRGEFRKSTKWLQKNRDCERTVHLPENLQYVLESRRQGRPGGGFGFHISSILRPGRRFLWAMAEIDFFKSKT